MFWLPGTNDRKKFGDEIIIGSKFPGEYAGSNYTKRLKGALAKAKANAIIELEKIIENATDRKWEENREQKHSNDAKQGWYRYNVHFSIPVYDDRNQHIGENLYSAQLVARINDEGIFLHDMVKIKKEASKPFESK